MTSTEIHGTARIVIRPGKLEEFKLLATRCTEVVREKDPGTVEYDQFLNEERMECFVHERYRDSAAGLAHMQNIAEVAALMSDVCTMTGEVCGTPSPELREALEAAGVTIYAPLVSLAG